MQANLLVFGIRDNRANLSIEAQFVVLADAISFTGETGYELGGFIIDPETGGLFVDPETGGLLIAM